MITLILIAIIIIIKMTYPKSDSDVGDALRRWHHRRFVVQQNIFFVCTSTGKGRRTGSSSCCGPLPPLFIHFLFLLRASIELKLSAANHQRHHHHHHHHHHYPKPASAVVVKPITTTSLLLSLSLRGKKRNEDTLTPVLHCHSATSSSSSSSTSSYKSSVHQC